jgi:hypothetical protein
MGKSKIPPFIDQPLNLKTHKLGEEMNLNLHVKSPNSKKIIFGSRMKTQIGSKLESRMNLFELQLESGLES